MGVSRVRVQVLVGVVGCLAVASVAVWAVLHVRHKLAQQELRRAQRRDQAVYEQVLAEAEVLIRQRKIRSAIPQLGSSLLLPHATDKTKAQDLLAQCEVAVGPAEETFRKMDQKVFEEFLEKRVIPSRYALPDPDINACFRQTLLWGKEREAARRKAIQEKEAARLEAERLAAAKRQRDAEIAWPTDSFKSGTVFHEPGRAMPYWANEVSKHRTRQAAIDALARQFGQSAAWVEANMGSSNDLHEIHSRLVGRSLRGSGL